MSAQGEYLASHQALIDQSDKGPVAPLVSTRQTPEKARWKSFLKRTTLWTAYIAALVGLWQAIVTIGGFKSYLFPSPSEVWHSAAMYPSVIASNCWVTVYESLLGFVLALFVGVLLAIVVIFVPSIRQIVVPSVVALNTLPKVAIAPIIVVFLGLGTTSKIVMAFLLAFFPIFVNEVGGLSDVDGSMLEYLKLLQATRIQTLFFARIPSSLPALFDGMKIALSLSMVGALVGEFIASSKGLGYEITIAYSTNNTSLVWALVIVVSVVATLMYFVLILIDKLVTWRFPSRRRAS